MKFLHLSTAFVLLCNSFFVSSQNETKKWYFGTGAGLDFTSSPPASITGSMNALEGCSSISDANGGFLFCCNGLTIYNQQLLPMANGSGLNGGQTQSTSQAALIVKQPGNQFLYYVFTLDEKSGGKGLCYSIVDMSLAAGMGSVTAKNVLLQTPSSEKLCAVKHCNGIDVWIVTHDAASANFRSFQLSATGIGPPIVSITGSSLNSFNLDDMGYLKISPNGKKLGHSVFGAGRFELYDFDNATGFVSNPLVLGSFPGAYSCEFSPDGSKFYGVTEVYDNNELSLYLTQLYQWDLCAGSATAVKNSVTNLKSGTLRRQGLQLGPDGKLYVSLLFKQSLGVINDPNKAGSSCNYVEPSLTLTGTAWAGLPNFVSSYFKSPGPEFTYSFQGNTVTFAASTCTFASGPLPNVLWDFGDPASGASNTSTLFSADHQYAQPGTYTIQLILYYPCYTDTIRQVIRSSEFTGLSPNSQTTGVKAFPNPVKNVLNLEYEAGQELKRSDLKLINLLGEEVLCVPVNGNEPSLQLDMSFLKNGIYFLYVFREGRMFQKEKIIKE